MIQGELVPIALSPGLTLTSETFWKGALALALVDVGLVALLAWRIRPARFRQLKGVIFAAAAVGWGLFSAALLWGFWDSYYRYFYPGWTRWLPPLYALFYGGLGLLFWWLAPRLPGNPVVSFCLLGGLESLLEHVWGIYGMGVLEVVPSLVGVSPFSVLAFAVPEYVLYWGVVLGMGALLDWARAWWP